MPKSSKEVSRKITDSFGTVVVPAGALYDKTPPRWVEKFGIGEPLPFEFVQSLAIVKKACAFANRDLGVLSTKKARAIAGVCDEIIAGKYKDQFPVSYIQSGSGTITNMNINEVIANVAHLNTGGSLEDNTKLLHPNDEVNASQSTNDVFPTAMQVATVLALTMRTIPAISALAEASILKGEENWDVIMAGRTHLMDAVPIRLGMKIDAWGRREMEREEVLIRSLDHLSILPIGGTALGSGINAPEGFDGKVVDYITEFTGFQFKAAENKAVAISSHDAMVEASSAMEQLAASLVSITSHIRWLASGPRTGIAELKLPASEPGSSIMPGKVNPSVLEGVQMACYEVMGKHQAITVANMHSSELDMNTAKPLIAKLSLESANLLADVCELLNEGCIKGIKANLEVIQANLDKTLMTVTALNLHIGYDKAGKIARKAIEEGSTLREAAIVSGYVSEEDFDKWVRPEDMV